MDTKNQANVLIVDDNPYNLEVLSRRLVRRGYNTTCVASGAEAIEQITKGGFDLVLLDIMMPNIDGMRVLTVARENFSKTELPIIMVSSKGESEDVVEALNHGANDYVVKPIDFPVALARIQTQLSQKQERSQQDVKNHFSLKIGERFGPYLVKKKVGQGGMGAVYRVHDPNLNRDVALKVILSDHELTESQVERFKREAKAIARIKHPNIVSIHRIEDQPRHYFIMDFIEGDNLSRWIREGKLGLKRATSLCRQIASALHSAHEKGIIHRDLKPSNIMIDTEGEPHLMDFGLAKMEHEEEPITRSNDIIGTPEYMAPEQIDPTYGKVDVRSDVYSLGSILFEMLTSRPPITGTAIHILWQKLNRTPAGPSTLNPEISPGLEAVCLKAVARDQAERFQTAKEMHDALTDLIAGEEGE